MNKKTKIIRNVIVGITVIVVVVGAGLYTSVIKLPITSYISPVFPPNFDDDRVLVGAKHNIFVAKVIKKVGSKNSKNFPQTQFEVEVIYNIKGDLRGKAVVSQIGGYRNGVLYLVQDGDVLAPGSLGGEPFYKPGETRLFTTRYSKNNDWHVGSTFPGAQKIISVDTNLSNDQLRTLAENDERVNEYREAYPNEILSAADIHASNTRNSYESVYGSKLEEEIVENQ